MGACGAGLADVPTGGRTAPVIMMATASSTATARRPEHGEVVAEEADQRRPGQERAVADRGDHADPAAPPAPARRRRRSSRPGSPSDRPSPHSTRADEGERRRTAPKTNSSRPTSAITVSTRMTATRP